MEVVRCKRKLKVNGFYVNKGDEGVLVNERIGIININNRVLCLNRKLVKRHFRKVVEKE